MESSNSRFGVRGSEKLGGGLKAIFQLETAFSVDSNNSAFAARDSFVGLSHAAWGTIKLGRMDTPFKTYGDDISFLGVSSGNFVSTSDVNRNIPFGTSNAGRFHERAQNMVDYETPRFAGFQGEVQYSTAETDTAFRHPHFWSGGVKWEGGPFEIAVASETHWDFFGLSANVPSAMRNNGDATARSKDTASSIMVKYKWGNHQFEVDANQKQWKEYPTVTGRAAKYKNNSYMFIWESRWSNTWRTAFHYVKATDGSCERLNAACTTDGPRRHPDLGRRRLLFLEAHLPLPARAVAEERPFGQLRQRVATRQHRGGHHPVRSGYPPLVLRPQDVIPAGDGAF
jgi:predicted porin